MQLPSWHTVTVHSPASASRQERQLAYTISPRHEVFANTSDNKLKDRSDPSMGVSTLWRDSPSPGKVKNVAMLGQITVTGRGWGTTHDPSASQQAGFKQSSAAARPAGFRRVLQPAPAAALAGEPPGACHHRRCPPCGTKDKVHSGNTGKQNDQHNPVNLHDHVFHSAWPSRHEPIYCVSGATCAATCLNHLE